MTGNQRQRGVGLLEVMVAMTVLLFGLLGVLGLNGIGVRLNGDGRRVTRATALARDLMSQMELWDYGTDARLTLGAHTEDELTGANFFGLPGDPGNVNRDSPRAVYGSNYFRSWSVADAPSVDSANPASGKLITLTVSWDNGTSQEGTRGTSSAVFFLLRAAPAGARL